MDENSIDGKYLLYNENEDQLFVRFDLDSDPVEFLLTKQPLAMIKSGFINKDEVRETIELGLQLEPENFYRTFERTELDLGITLRVRIDLIIQVVELVEAQIFCGSYGKFKTTNR